ncbi:MAG TPA: hypothetical protein VGV67_14200, partial [Solirubrobacteraceae bacterium]|nr:hypothetical protein [Solirubrobacteraceae bacterium]
MASLLIIGLLLAGCPRDDGDDGGDGASEAAGQGGGGGRGGSNTLAEVERRGELVCGVNEEVPGFGFVTEAGDYEGFDIEFCKVVAA